jgi:hypothetical protein
MRHVTRFGQKAGPILRSLLSQRCQFDPRLTVCVFVTFALPLCLFLTLVVPPGQVADEDTHVLRADSLRHGAIVGHRETRVAADGISQVMAGVNANPALMTVVNATPPRAPYDRSKVDSVKELPWTPSDQFFPVFATYGPIFTSPLLPA